MVRLSLSLAVLSLLSSSNECVEAKSNKDHPLMSPWSFVAKVKGGGSATLSSDHSDHVILGEDEEATESLEVSIPLSQSPRLLPDGQDAPLMRDISMLSEILMDIVEREDPNVHDLFEEFLDYGKER
jgi:hypothetical protein